MVGPSSERPSRPLPLPVLAVRHAICSFCLTFFPKLNKCGGCKRVSYCSKICQQKDWRNGHKSTCKVLIESNKRKIPESRVGRTWGQYRSEKKVEIELFRLQNPHYTENDHRLFMYEPFCRHCYRTAPSLDANNQLQSCRQCRIASFCLECLQAHPTMECDLFQEIREDETFLIDYYKQTGDNFAIFPTEQPRATYIPLSTCAGWYDFCTRISDKDMMGPLITNEMKPASTDELAVRLAGSIRLSSGTTSMALTILAALETQFCDLTSRSSIKLHIIGAATRELDGLMIFEEILHLLPSLKHLGLTFVGPDLPPESVTNDKQNCSIELQSCPACSSQGRTKSLSVWRGSYHAFARKAFYEIPDLAVAFHTGFSQEAQESWLPTIHTLAKAPYSTLFTSFNQNEMREEITILEGMGASFRQGGAPNKWRGLCPMLEVMEEIESSVYYFNQYWYIVAAVV